jgi:hypothetical protein
MDAVETVMAFALSNRFGFGGGLRNGCALPAPVLERLAYV